jgi:hypothetical protein
MNISQLVTRINAQWPFPNSSALDIAYEDYRSTLGLHQGPRLHAAWDATVAVWRSANRPLPADIAAHLPTGPVKSTGPKVDWDEVRRIQHAMCTDWWRDHQDEIGEFLQQFAHDDRAERLLAEVGPPRPTTAERRGNLEAWMGIGGTDRDAARANLADLIKRRAWLEAQRRHLALPMQGLEVKGEDYERICGQVRSQTGTYPKRLRDLGPGYGDLRSEQQRRIQPRYLRSHHREEPAPAPGGHHARLPERTESAPDLGEDHAQDVLPDGRPVPPVESDPFGVGATL